MNQVGGGCFKASPAAERTRDGSCVAAVRDDYTDHSAHLRAMRRCDHVRSDHLCMTESIEQAAAGAPC